VLKPKEHSPLVEGLAELKKAHIVELSVRKEKLKEKLRGEGRGHC